MAKTHTHSKWQESPKSLSLRLWSLLEFLQWLVCLFCCVMSCFALSFFFLFLYPSPGTWKNVIPVSTLNVIHFAASMDTNAVSLCVTASLFVITYLFQRISTFEHTSRILISNVTKRHASVRRKPNLRCFLC